MFFLSKIKKYIFVTTLFLTLITEANDSTSDLNSYERMLLSTPTVTVINESPVKKPVFKPRPVSWKTAIAPKLNSYIQAREVIFLNFSGRKDRNVMPYGHQRRKTKDNDLYNFSAAELEDIKNIWETISEKYAPFAVNVTTDPDKYDYANKHNLSRTIVDLSPTHNSASWSSNWFTNGGYCSINLGASLETTIAHTCHELAHSMGLDHDCARKCRLPNHRGKLTNYASWGPMFKAGNTLAHWSKNEVLMTDYARRQREPLETITSEKNKIGYKTDDHGNAPITASLLLPGKNTQNGIIERNTDVDLFRFSTLGGPVKFSIKPHNLKPVMLDILAELYDSNGTRITLADPQDDIAAQISIANLKRGTYYLHISGTGMGTPGAGGYSDYGSIGPYTIDAQYLAEPIQQDIIHGLSTVKYKSGLLHKGLIQIPATGLYSFYATDKCKLSIGQRYVIYNNSSTTVNSTKVYLAAGLYPIFIESHLPANKLPLQYSGPGVIRQQLPIDTLYKTPPEALVPISNNDNYALVNDKLTITKDYGILHNDSNYNGKPLHIRIVENVKYGKLNLKKDGSFKYYVTTKLKPGQIDSFTYQLSDGKSASKTATVKIRIWGPQVDFRNFELVNYMGTGLSYGSHIENNGKTLRLNASDCSKKIALPYKVTPNTVLAFDFNIATPGRFHQIGFINNKVGVDPAKLFRLAGSCGGKNHGRRFEALGDITDFFKGAGSYKIPVGKFFTGQMQALCFGNWSDTNSNVGTIDMKAITNIAESTFSNVRIYEDNKPELSYIANLRPIKPLTRPKTIIAKHSISKVFTKLISTDAKRRQLYAPLHGMFNGSQDDLYMTYKLVQNIETAGWHPVKIQSNNAGSYLVFSKANSPQGFTDKMLIFEVSDGQNKLRYRCKISWNATNDKLTAIKAAD